MSGRARRRRAIIAAMNTALLISSLAGVATAFGHSWLGETMILRPLYRERKDQGVLAPAATRRILRAVFHLPSLAWALTAIMTFGFVYHGTTPPIFFTVYGAALYGLSAMGNLWGLRRVHVGNVLLTIAAVALVVGAV